MIFDYFDDWVKEILGIEPCEITHITPEEQKVTKFTVSVDDLINLWNAGVENGLKGLVQAKDKVIKELEEKISVLLSCKNCPENKGGYICKKEYENKCLAQKIQYIKELKEDNKVMADNYSKMEQKFYDNLIQAKELLARWVSDKPYTVSEQKDLISDTEQFLKEV